MIILMIEVFRDIVLKAIPLFFIFMIIKKIFKFDYIPILLIFNISLLISTLYKLFTLEK